MTTDDDRADERRARGIDDEEAPPCSTCGGACRIEIRRVQYVSRDMATDAGAPEMEGMEIDDGTEWIDCPDCPPPTPPLSPADRIDLDLPF